jgi:hypothetical protein
MVKKRENMGVLGIFLLFTNYSSEYGNGNKTTGMK